jgi:N-acetylglucosamine kinase-like BadF-type ATPase
VRRAALLAADGGASKTDVALLGRDGRVLASVRAGGASFHPSAHERSVRTLVDGVQRAAAAAGIDPAAGPVAEQGAFCLAGADLPVDDRRMLRALRGAGLAQRVLLRNDTFAVLRAGTERSWGIGVVCGTGLNCAGVAPDGRIVRFPALGPISGDWGGGGDLAVAGIGACVRARDGRGPATALEPAVLEHFGMRRPLQVMEAVHTGALGNGQLVDVARIVLRVADAGDPVAAALVERLADEVVALVRAATRRLRLTRRDPDVVLGGGIARSRSRLFHRLAAGGIADAVPGARVSVLHSPPVVGAALLGLDALGAPARAHTRARRELTVHRSS